MSYDPVPHDEALIRAYADEYHGGDWESVTVAEAQALLFHRSPVRKGARVD